MWTYLKKIEELNTKALDVQCLIEVIKDSCERNDYTSQQIALEKVHDMQQEIIYELDELL